MLLKDEEWKYTQIAESLFQDYAWVSGSSAAGASLDFSRLYASVIPPNSPVWIFENGVLLGQSPACPPTVVLTPNPSTAGNTNTLDSNSPAWLKICAEAALSQQGGKWHWTVTESLAEPLYIMHFYTGSQPKQAAFAQHHFTVAEGVSAELIEIHGDLYDGNVKGLCYEQTQIVLEKAASLQHHRLSLATASMTAVADLDVQIGAKASYDLRTVISGGKQHRRNTLLSLTGASAKVKVKCLHWANNQEQLDTHLEVRHQADGSESEVWVRGVASLRGTSTLTGKIVIPEAAKQCSAALENKNLLLSRDASINSRPQLEIGHNDIQRCMHGATIGCLDSEALLYLQSRGIPVAEAKRMLVEGFVEPVLAEFSPVFANALRAQLFGVSALGTG
jgi:Fe-S cluster assembly protein SufD